MTQPTGAVLASDEGPVRRLDGLAGRFVTALAVGLSLYAFYWVLFVVQPQIYRPSFLLISLVLCFLLFPRVRPAVGSAHRANAVSALDWGLVALSIVALGWPLVDFHAIVYRATEPRSIDLVLGGTLLLLVLEATRRAVGWILPLTALVFLAYAMAGPSLDDIGLSRFAHRGYNLDRLIGTLYMTLEGIFGVPLDVAATYIILFTIYGAVLERSGAGAFFIDWAMAAMGRSRSGAAPGRAVTVAGFLLGTVSGSGVATTVMLGSVSWPLLRRAGFRPETGGAILSAAGIGALLSPPTLGAAAFLIAEFLRISYLRVLVMAIIPTLLYYLSIFLMIEADSRRADTQPAVVESPGVWVLTRRYWYHFTSLAAISVLMAAGLSAFRSVFWATLLAVALSYVRRETSLTPARLIDALRT
ncbi:MAG: TRAP transporter large permease subunit, partial [Acidobacteria bacterium]|nr:TRAP transporter large permease subunit [Acidobacteriota bacterium]